MEEAENERMHLMTFIEVAQPTALERGLILVAQWIFWVAFFVLYLVSRRTAHRLVGYFEEEAVLSYTLYLEEIDAGRVPNVAAPPIARRYWKLADDATLRDVVIVVRADEAHHRDVNHGLANELSGQPPRPDPDGTVSGACRSWKIGVAERHRRGFGNAQTACERCPPMSHRPDCRAPQPRQENS